MAPVTMRFPMNGLSSSMKRHSGKFLSRIEFDIFRSFEEDAKAAWLKLERSGDYYVFLAQK